MIGPGTKYTDQIGVSVYINKDATLQDPGYVTLQLTSAPLSIVVEGKMVVYHGSGNGWVAIDSGSNSKDYINVNGGTLEFNGAGGQWDYFNVPILVQSGGTFAVMSGPLVVSGANSQTGNASVFMEGTSSSVQLSKSAKLQCNNDYYQDGGVLETMDSSVCILQDGPTGAAGTAKIYGGSVVVDNAPNSYGTLNVIGSLALKNTYVLITVEGYKPGNANPHDQLVVENGSLTGLATCSLIVGVNGTAQNGDVWLIITASSGIGADFGTKSSKPKIPGFTFGPPNEGKYKVQMPMN